MTGILSFLSQDLATIGALWHSPEFRGTADILVNTLALRGQFEIGCNGAGLIWLQSSP